MDGFSTTPPLHCVLMRDGRAWSNPLSHISTQWRVFLTPPPLFNPPISCFGEMGVLFQYTIYVIDKIIICFYETILSEYILLFRFHSEPVGICSELKPVNNSKWFQVDF